MLKKFMVVYVVILCFCVPATAQEAHSIGVVVDRGLDETFLGEVEVEFLSILENWNKQENGRFVIPESEIEKVKNWIKKKLGIPRQLTVKLVAPPEERGSAIQGGIIKGQVILGVSGEWQTIDFAWDLKKNVARRISIGPITDLTWSDSVKIFYEFNRVVGKDLLLRAGVVKDGKIVIVTIRPSADVYDVTKIKFLVGTWGKWKRAKVENHEVYRDGGTQIFDTSLGRLYKPTPFATDRRATFDGKTIEFF